MNRAVLGCRLRLIFTLKSLQLSRSCWLAGINVRGGMLQKLRGKRVAQMINELEAEGVVISEAVQAMLCAYVKGSVSGADLLAHAVQFCDLSSYQSWLSSNFGGAYPTMSSEVSIEQLVAEMASSLRHRSAETSTRPVQTPWAHRHAAELLKPYRLGRRVPSIVGLIDPSPVTAQALQAELHHTP